MTRRDQLDAAAEAFERFHAREAGAPVYPYHRDANGVFELDIAVPEMAHVGKALRVLYRSDKWHKAGKTTDYYHDHGEQVGPVEHVHHSDVRFWLPAGHEEARSGRRRRFPHEWPDSVTVLGECIGWYFRPFDSDGDEVVEGEPRGCLLVASPDGYVDPRDPERIFLAVVDMDTAKVEALIEGPGLRLTAHGIEG